MTVKSLKITRPDDWHVHLREGNLLKTVINHSTRVNHRCIVTVSYTHLRAHETDS